MPNEPLDHVVWYMGHYNGDCVIFWGPNETGYTTDLDKAGRYTKTHAREIAARRGLERAVPLKAAEVAARRHVTSERLLTELELEGLGL